MANARPLQQAAPPAERSKNRGEREADGRRRAAAAVREAVFIGSSGVGETYVGGSTVFSSSVWVAGVEVSGVGAACVDRSSVFATCVGIAGIEDSRVGEALVGGPGVTRQRARARPLQSTTRPG